MKEEVMYTAMHKKHSDNIRMNEKEYSPIERAVAALEIHKEYLRLRWVEEPEGERRAYFQAERSKIDYVLDLLNH